MTIRFIKKLVFIPVLALCACSSSEPQDGYYDPFENVNRAVYGFNDVVDDMYITPMVETYRYAAPEPARNALRNFLRNLRSPVTLANQLLQGDLDGAGDVLLRTTINTFVGFGGLFDVAGHEGIEYEAEDFGQTLAVWGVPDGPYLVLPVLGPSSTRDYAGYVVDTVADPLNLYLSNTDRDGLLYARAGLSYLDLRESLYEVMQDLESNSIDEYATVRSTFYQRRQALIEDLDDGNLSGTSDFDDIY